MTRATVPLSAADEGGLATDSDRAAAELAQRLVEHVRRLRRFEQSLVSVNGDETATRCRRKETVLEAVDCTVEELAGGQSVPDRMVVRDAVAHYSRARTSTPTAPWSHRRHRRRCPWSPNGRSTQGSH